MREGIYQQVYKRIINKFFQGVIDQAESQDEKEIVSYGLEVILSQLVSILAIFLIGILSHNLIETVVFILCFCSIRVVAGGYHANTHLFCFLNTVLSYLLLIVINTHITMEHNKILMLIAGICYSIIWVLAPIFNDKRKFSIEELHIGRKKTKIFLLLEVFITIVLYHVNFNLYKFAIYAIILEGVYLIVGKIKYWDLNKKTVLKNVMNLSIIVAYFSAGMGSMFFFHEPAIPKALKKKCEEKKASFSRYLK